ncbi:MAG: hypothetical protein ACJAVI_005222 [Candidatus Azotimanducaceae bacterium]|jgi:hypothetical protein
MIIVYKNKLKFEFVFKKVESAAEYKVSENIVVPSSGRSSISQETSLALPAARGSLLSTLPC